MLSASKFEYLVETDRADLCLFEHNLWTQGVLRVAGVDEVGRGPLAGPVVAAAVVMPIGIDIPGIIDSKQMTPCQRMDGYERIIKACGAVNGGNIGVAAVSVKVIDRINILQAALLAMSRAIARLDPMPDYLLVDGLYIPPNVSLTAMALVKGDSRSRSIAAASVIAKVIRDRLMTNLNPLYPEYSFASNKGYGSPSHIEAILRLGGTPHHRKSFAPLKNMQIGIDLAK